MAGNGCLISTYIVKQTVQTQMQMSLPHLLMNVPLTKVIKEAEIITSAYPSVNKKHAAAQVHVLCDVSAMSKQTSGA